MKIIVDEEGKSAVMQILDSMFKMYGLNFLKDYNSIVTSLEVLPDEEIEVKEEK